MPSTVTMINSAGVVFAAKRFCAYARTAMSCDVMKIAAQHDARRASKVNVDIAMHVCMDARCC